MDLSDGRMEGMGDIERLYIFIMSSSAFTECENVRLCGNLAMVFSIMMTQAIGHATNFQPFDDLREVGLWPMAETVSKVEKISMWVSRARVNAIETTYRLINVDHCIVVGHGRKVGTQVDFEAGANRVFVGVVGACAVDELKDRIRLMRIGFLVHDLRTGQLETLGAVEAPPSSAYSENM
ncbi:hypothetical protein D9615_009392 [Tricholomella constricta]|uniref:Uncharacterized protein n=1 Tax=Tricholomella constricta TaxID=117010 RepID=A0A8H5H2L7_9AGAR|nr:hypothetical protein D9615_009392 [Tricholomella constricta]